MDNLENIDNIEVVIIKVKLSNIIKIILIRKFHTKFHLYLMTKKFH